MDRVNGRDWIDIGGGRRGFKSQNAGAGIPGTEVTDDFLNAIQEELAGLVEGSGQALAAGDTGQVTKAVGLLVQSGKWLYVAAAGTANALTATLAPAPLALVAGMAARIKIAANNTGAATLNVNGLGVKAIKRLGGAAVVADDLVAGQILTLVYDGATWRSVSALASDQRAAGVAPLTTYLIQSPGAWAWNVPDGVTSILIRLWGGGGGGGYNASGGNTAGPSGGGGGGYAERRFLVTAGQLISGTVGAGGTGGRVSPTQDGQPGLASTATVGGVTVSALGGEGGKNANGTNTTADGAGGGWFNNADYGIRGGPGLLGFARTGIALGAGGYGGSSPFGGQMVFGGGGANSAGEAPGGGGGATGDASYWGAAGARGEVRIVY